ncbi:hypothetical protein D7294_14410 [Streptomyces hoynatensis]|uniref:Endonuclease/exonuclease/phosphatase domain-containing protein n=1 Tax=Streptomyces hoynatensis TaxID=1141874 RepID=A0A3A9Z0D8_9ACTN|nr:hypothetical protein D7294_14410 [Streptomyces hoynatensis]
MGLTRSRPGTLPSAAATAPWLTGVAALVALELLRLSGVAARGPVAPVLVCLCAAAGGPLVWWLGSRRALPAAVGGLALARLLVQLPFARVLPVVAFALGLAFAVLVLAVRACADTGRAARALALAAGADAALRLCGDLLDPVWHRGAAGWLPALLLALALAGLAWCLYQEPAARPAGGVPLALLGAPLAWYGLLAGSPSYLSAEAEVSASAAGLWVAAGALAGVWAMGERWPAPAVLAPALAAFVLLPGWAACPAAALALAALPAVLRRALALRPPAWAALAPPYDLALAGAAGALGCLLVALPLQHGVAPGAFVLITAFGTALAALGAPGGPPLPRPFAPVLLAVALLAAPPLTGALRPAPAPLPTDTAGGIYRLLTWNVSAAVDRGGELDPGAVLDAVEEAGADIVVLQEVPRGLAGAGGLDLRAWLARQLGATAVWAPAGEPQRGTLVLTGLPVVGAETSGLPGDGSLAAVEVRLANGATARLVTARAEPGEATSRALLAAVGEDPHAVLAGDLGAGPGSPEARAALGAGLHGAEEAAGAGSTTDAAAEGDRVLGARDVAFGDFGRLAARGFAHAPLAVTVYLD